MSLTYILLCILTVVFIALQLILFPKVNVQLQSNREFRAQAFRIGALVFFMLGGITMLHLYDLDPSPVDLDPDWTWLALGLASAPLLIFLLTMLYRLAAWRNKAAKEEDFKEIESYAVSNRGDFFWWSFYGLANTLAVEIYRYLLFEVTLAETNIWLAFAIPGMITSAMALRGKLSYIALAFVSGVISCVLYYYTNFWAALALMGGFTQVSRTLSYHRSQWIRKQAPTG